MAVQILAVRNPGAIEAGKIVINALMKNVKRPNVRIFMGRVKSMSIGFTKRFRVPKTIATMIAVTKSSTTTPGIIREATNIAKVAMTSLSSSFISTIIPNYPLKSRSLRLRRRSERLSSATPKK